MARGGAGDTNVAAVVLGLLSLVPLAVVALIPTPMGSLQYSDHDGSLQDNDGGFVRPDDFDWREQENTKCSEGVLSCVRRDLAADLSAILSADIYNVTSSLAVERVRQGGDALRRAAPSLGHAGLATLAGTAIRLFQTHALVWRLWPGVMHVTVYNDPAGGMDAGIELQPALTARTWGALAARRRLTMALLPIMYKMGVGTTLLGVLTFIAMKTMFMVSILFVLAVSSFFKHKLSAVPYLPVAHPHKEVHLHVHTDPHRQGYGGWHRHGPSVEGGSGYHQGYHEYPPVYHNSDYSSAPPEDSPYYGPGPHISRWRWEPAWQPASGYYT